MNQEFNNVVVNVTGYQLSLLPGLYLSSYTDKTKGPYNLPMMSRSARESTETSLPSFANTLSPRSSFSPDIIAVMSREGKTHFPDACRTVADGLLLAFAIVRA